MTYPALALFSVFFLAAIVGSLLLSFTNWSVYYPNDIQFNGISNFQELFNDPHFRAALENVVVFALVTTALMTGLGTALALVLNRRFRGRNVYRAIFFLPYLLSAYAVGYIFTFVLDPQHGLVNGFLRIVGLGALAKDWLGSPSLALLTVCAVQVWIGTGFAAVIVLAALQTVPQELKEAVALDGAGRIAEFRAVTVPFLMPALTVIVTINIIAGFRVFDLVEALTGGGPGYATEVINTLQYNSLGLGALGYASAIGLTQFAIIAAVTIPVMTRLQRKQLVQ
jgi:raffinose/stachyose/melibiose transport system permease protein